MKNEKIKMKNNYLTDNTVFHTNQSETIARGFSPWIIFNSCRNPAVINIKRKTNDQDKYLLNSN